MLRPLLTGADPSQVQKRLGASRFFAFQVMWADTSQVGCGYALCPNIFDALGRHHLLVCHYSPVGNLVQVTADGQYVGSPMFIRGSSEEECTDCPSDTKCEDGLCA